jgi:hypothetical protein
MCCSIPSCGIKSSDVLPCCSLMKTDAEASLHIGLGIGMTAKAFAEHGLRTDVIELHPEVSAAGAGVVRRDTCDAVSAP